jgi:two-component system nitrogen regulation response regulator NtrX
MAHDILIVDDEDDIRFQISGILNDEGYDTREADGDVSALQEIEVRRPSLVVLDIWLEGSQRDGLELLKLIHHDHPDVPVVIISGHGTIEMAVQAIKFGAYDFIEKPFKADRLLLIIDRAIESARLRRENQELRARTGGKFELIGNSQPLGQLRQSIDKVSPTSSRVLITGASGTGKEVVARLIHANSKRTEGPFIVVNCATMAPERMETELFGTVSDGLVSEGVGKVGLFEQAHGGTLFLDEVPDMPLETQGKIVRVLQDQTFERVGGGGQVEVSVRVIAGTSRDLPELISAGTFREDLFYRLNVVPVSVPPLSERREDIPALVDYFMSQAADVNGAAPRNVGPDAMAALQAYDWPGNVRQLRNVVDWLLIMAPGDNDQIVRADMLPPEIGTITPPILRFEQSFEFLGLPLRDAREEFERQYLGAQVTRFGGNISRTANFVGMERSALHRKLKTLGVQGSTQDPAREEDVSRSA